jgi:ABC-type glycerol-3-phosphate transport system permease component
MNRSFADGAGKTITTALLIVASVVAITPIVWLVAASLKGQDDIFHYMFFPPLSKLTAANFRDLFALTHFWRYLLSSMFTTGATVLCQLFFSSLAGYGLAKYQFKGKTVVMALMLGTMMLPGSITMAPLYDLLYRLHLVDSYAGLIVPGAISVFGIFLFRQSILQVPDELLQAARLDGCSEFRIYWNVVMPVSRPMVGAFCLISFMGAWNNFLWPQIILHHDNLFTVPIGLNQLIGTYSSHYGMLMAGTLLGVLPVAVLFLFLQKEFVAGLTAGAVKG